MHRILLALAALTLGSGLAAGYNLSAPILPDPKLSPGDVLTSDPKLVCVSGYTKTVRNVPQALKEQVYREYGITSRQPGEYEVDHIISLELGGSNSIRNLYPESYKTQPLNAHVKDTLENRLHALACSGKITLQEAQQAIASNWTVAYVKYVGSLPGGASVTMTTSSPAMTKTTVPVVPVPGRPPAQPSGGQPGPATGGTSPGPGGSCPASAPIKGNNGRTRIYHLPGDPYYARTKAEACFSSAQAAQAAGFRGIK
ncbi:HNH endonuclease signature motif containing protein [Deinococcus sp. UYEF24]